jgi:predicted O-methyltransferase YrrM
MTNIDEAVKRAIDCNAMLYNRKSNCPDDKRDAELKWLYHLAEISPDGRSIELGVREGGSLLCWSMAREGRGAVYGVDIKARPSLTENLEKYGLKAHLIISPSNTAAIKVKGKVAFCFIDADHSEDGVRADVAVWPDKVIPGGILAFHDYGVWKPSVKVKDVVDEWQAANGWELLGQVGSLIAFKKPE